MHTRKSAVVVAAVVVLGLGVERAYAGPGEFVAAMSTSVSSAAPNSPPKAAATSGSDCSAAKPQAPQGFVRWLLTIFGRTSGKTSNVAAEQLSGSGRVEVCDSP